MLYEPGENTEPELDRNEQQAMFDLFEDCRVVSIGEVLKTFTQVGFSATDAVISLFMGVGLGKPTDRL